MPKGTRQPRGHSRAHTQRPSPWSPIGFDARDNGDNGRESSGSWVRASEAVIQSASCKSHSDFEPRLPAFPAKVFSPGRMARQCGAVASCRLVAGAARASTGAARPGRPQEGPARSRRDRHESGGTARGRSLWTHRGERLGEAITPQAKAGEHSLMQLRLHANATTTPRTRAYIQKSRASHAALARELGIHPRTVVRWKARQDVADRSTRPHRSATSISEWEEALIVELRRSLALPLDDIVEAMRRCLNPKLSRSGIHRCLQRHGLSARLTPQAAPAVAFQTDTPAGFIHIDVKYLPPLARRRSYAYVAIDRATRFVYLEILPDRRATTAAAFLERFLDRFPLAV